MSCAGRRLTPEQCTVFRTELEFEQLSEKHVEMIPRFSCHQRIDDYLRRLALVDGKEKRSVTWVLVHEGKFLVAMITLAMGVVDLGEAERRARNLPGQSDYPGVLIGQLGTDKDYLRRGLAKRLIKFAVGRATEFSQSVGCRVLIAEVNMEEPAITMYRNAGFERTTHRLYRQETTTQTHFLDVFSNPPPELGSGQSS